MKDEIKNSVVSIKDYLEKIFLFCNKRRIFILIILIISFKLTDSCISILKPMFLHFLGISKIIFANIVYVYGLIPMIIAGVIAGFALNKWKLLSCIKLSLMAQMFVSACFIYLSMTRNGNFTIFLVCFITTFVSGFSVVVFRTYIATESDRDVIIYTLLLSLGSLFRTFVFTLSGDVVESYTWGGMYLLCLLSNIPGLLVSLKLSHSK